MESFEVEETNVSMVELSLKRLERINQYIKDQLLRHTRMIEPITIQKLRRSGIILKSTEEYLFKDIFNNSKEFKVEFWLERQGSVIGERLRLNI